MTEQELQQIEAAKAALDKATKEKWYRQETIQPGEGIRTKNGFICFMFNPAHYPMQDERYAQEIEQANADAALIAAAPAIVRRVQELEAENKELNDLFDMQWTRSKEADELWRKAHPGNELVCPDLGDLLTWLMERIAGLENWQKKALEWLRVDYDDCVSRRGALANWEKQKLEDYNGAIEELTALIEQAEGGK